MSQQRYAPVLPGMFNPANQAPATPVGALLEQVEARANRIRPNFTDDASRFVLEYLRTHGKQTAERVTDAAKAAGIQTSDDRHFGVIFQRLSRLGAIRKVGYEPRVKGHGSGAAPVWELGR